MLSDVNGATGFQLEGVPPGSGSNFGNAMRPAGDVNGDGLEDVIIGANYENLYAGSAYVLFGRTNGFSPPPDVNNLMPADGFAIRGFNTQVAGGNADYAGTSVSGAGDINGDGFDDVVVAAAIYGGGDAYNISAAYVIFGKANNSEVNLSAINQGGSDTTGFRLTGLAQTSQLQNSADFVSTGGDINGDGYDDVVFGSPKTGVAGGYGEGAAYVVFGKESGFANLNVSDLNGTSGFVFTDSLNGASANQGYIGAAVSIQGDVNGDGLSDLVIGAPKRNGYNGEVYVLFGRGTFTAQVEVNSLNGTTGFKATGVLAQQAATGTSVSSGGDVNGDGIDDFIVGSPGSYDYANLAGRAYVVYGKTNLGSAGTINLTALTGSTGFVLEGGANYDAAGTSVSITGDINGDGFDDIAVGAPERLQNIASPPARSGKAYVVFGSSNISVPGNLDAVDGTNGFKLTGSAGLHAGNPVMLGTDLNGDGFDELFIGEPYSTRGTVTVFIGTDFGLNDGAGVDELGNGLQKIDGSGAGTLTADAGSSSADILVGGGGDDTLTSDGGSDVLIGGSGDDILTANLSNFSNVPRFDGGTGVDTLTGDASFSGANINLTTIPGNRINDLEVIDLEDAATQTLTLDLATVLAITGSGPTTASSSPFATNDAHTLVILRDSDDVINGIVDGVNGWAQVANEMIDGKTFEVFTQDGATVKIQSAVTVTGNIDGDADFDSNDSFLINIVALGASDTLIDNFKGTSPLTAQEIRDAIAVLQSTGMLNVDGDLDTDSNDSFLVNIIKLGASDTLINNFKGTSPLTATQIRQNVTALSPPAARPAPPIQTFPAESPEESSKQELPEIPSFQTAPPPALVLNARSSDSEAPASDDSSGGASDSDSNTVASDEAFVTAQIDRTMNLLS